MTPDFLTAYNKTLAAEGNLSSNPADRGGMTYKGISRVKHPDWPGWLIVDKLISTCFAGIDDGSEVSLAVNKTTIQALENNDLLQNLVKVFYHEKYWITIRGDKLPSQSIADELFDCSVNLGLQAAAEILQRTINILNRNNRLFPDIDVDGIIGSQTLSALNKCILLNGEKLVFNLLNFYQAKRYIEIMERDRSQEVFVGWFDRVEVKKKGENCH